MRSQNLRKADFFQEKEVVVLKAGDTGKLKKKMMMRELSETRKNKTKREKDRENKALLFRHTRRRQ